MIDTRRVLYIIILIMLVYPNYLYSQDMAEGDGGITENFLSEQLDSLNLQELELVLEDIVQDNRDYYPEISAKDTILSMIRGKGIFKSRDIIAGGIAIFADGLIDNLALISQILIITVASSLLTNIQSAFEGDTVSKLAHYACYMLLSMLIINSFKMALDLGEKTVSQMVNFMQIILPMLLTLLTAIGGPSVKSLFHPMVIGAVNVIGSLIKNLVFPLIFFSFIIGIISNISQKVQFSKLSELMRQVIIVLVSISLTIFIGVITMYGMSSSVDGITIRTAKFAVDNLIPIIGKFLSDAVETVVGCSSILKNGIGMVGLGILLLICIIPVVKILTLLLVYKAVAAIVQPIGNASIVKCFDEINKSLLLVLISVLSIAIMFFITITVVVEVGNRTLMLR
ncbi:MAG: stage III sporulation protein AE [Tissierellia bacterium]|nr:stage III sporulation protein AE [Tissierellia bacterium]